MSIRRALPFLLLLAAAFPLPALSVDELDANASFLLIGSVPPAAYAADGPIPSLTYLIGASLPLRIAGPFFIEPGLEIYGDYYEWTGADATVIPVAYELGASFYAVGIILSAQAGLSFDLNKAIALGGAIGLDFLFRFPFELANTNVDSVAGQAAAPGFFYGMGRFFYPETRLFFRWRLTAPVDLVLNVRGFYPLFHLWDGLSQSFFDQFMLSAGVGFAVHLGQPAAPSK